MSARASLIRLGAAAIPARAKVNLALHVTGRREDGYHSLSSLVAFAEDGDTLSIEPAERDGFCVTGPFAHALAGCAPDENLVLKALALARAVAAARGLDLGPLAIGLDKRLPVASGIGGGSADAAALLGLVSAACPEIGADVRGQALRLGADVPMCLDGVPAFVEGVGEIGMPLERFPGVPCLLVNPGIAVATPEVFRRLTRRENPPLPAIPAGGFANAPALRDYLEETRNDLEAPAEEIAGEIGAVRSALRAAGAAFTRMSGSGATVFGLFGTDAEAKAAATALAARQPGWWIMATRLAPAGDGSADR